MVIGGLFGLWRWRVDRKEAQDKELEDRKEAQDKELKDRQAERERRDEEQKRWLKDQEAERDKRAEERFQTAVTGLGDEKEGAKIGAAILLRTFLRPGYEQFYTQTFDLAVANLRLPRTPHPSEDPDGVPYQPKDQESPLPLTTLSQALIVAFKEAFPLARDTKFGDKTDALQSLDATNIQLDNAYLVGADLKQAWMSEASLRKATLRGATLRGAYLAGATLRGATLNGATLNGADLSRATLSGATLNGATLNGADLSRATLSGANFSNADLSNADLSRAILGGADLSGAILGGADLSGATLNANFNGANLCLADLSNADLSNANLSNANLSNANLSGANLIIANLSNADLSGANPEDARFLEDTKLYSVKGLDEKQLAGCELKGAVIDKDSTTSLFQSTASPSPSSNVVQAPSTSLAQGNRPTPNTSDSSAASSKSDPEP